MPLRALPQGHGLGPCGQSVLVNGRPALAVRRGQGANLQLPSGRPHQKLLLHLRLRPTQSAAGRNAAGGTCGLPGHRRPPAAAGAHLLFPSGELGSRPGARPKVRYPPGGKTVTSIFVSGNNNMAFFYLFYTMVSQTFSWCEW